MGPSTRWQVAMLSDTGRGRVANEDVILVDRACGLAVVADGVGGHKGGVVAARTAVASVRDGVRERVHLFDPESPLPEPGKLSRMGRWILDLLLGINQAIHLKARKAPGRLGGMCTALVMALFHGNRVIIANVGDCRLYRFRENRCERLTTDHTLYQEWLDRGCPAWEAWDSVSAHVLAQALGSQEEVRPAVREERVLHGDTFLLCSDGLTDMVKEEEIFRVVQQSESLSVAATSLVAKANAAGGTDNISVVLIRTLGPFRPRRVWWMPLRALWHRLSFQLRLGQP
ncbi:MAG: serine/threonine-protein phosphatase [Magnetococcales bacterium]|nr:serine/threonine-protein phosphatase [Magnetococcales bacterium]MBF0156619.1 serine/threonine-protein phosphatase [Magnetococcales bacterium]